MFAIRGLLVPSSELLRELNLNVLLVSLYFRLHSPINSFSFHFHFLFFHKFRQLPLCPFISYSTSFYTPHRKIINSIIIWSSQSSMAQKQIVPHPLYMHSGNDLFYTYIRKLCICVSETIS